MRADGQINKHTDTLSAILGAIEVIMEMIIIMTDRHSHPPVAFHSLGVTSRSAVMNLGGTTTAN